MRVSVRRSDEEKTFLIEHTSEHRFASRSLVEFGRRYSDTVKQIVQFVIAIFFVSSFYFKSPSLRTGAFEANCVACLLSFPYHFSELYKRCGDLTLACVDRIFKIAFLALFSIVTTGSAIVYGAFQAVRIVTDDTSAVKDWAIIAAVFSLSFDILQVFALTWVLRHQNETTLRYGMDKDTFWEKERYLKTHPKDAARVAGETVLPNIHTQRQVALSLIAVDALEKGLNIYASRHFGTRAHAFCALSTKGLELVQNLWRKVKQARERACLKPTVSV